MRGELDHIVAGAHLQRELAAACLRVIEVENNALAEKLLVALRKGRIGASTSPMVEDGLPAAAEQKG